jgi:HK97 family phage major capsid protein
MSINELRTKRASLWEETKKFLAEHTDKDGKMAAADAEAYEKMEADIAEMGKTIDRLEKQAEMDKKLAMPTSKPLVGAPGKPEKKGTASDEYRKAMFTAIRTKFRDVSNVLQEGIDEAGGYLVPDEYDRRLIDVLDEENVLRGLATTIRTSGERKINIAATKPAALWVEEGGALTFGDATFDQKLLDAHKLHVAIKITEELLADNAFQLEDYIIAQFGKAIANAEEDAFLNGDGEGKPTGLFADAQVGVTIGTVEIEADDVIDLIYKLKRPYRKKASFITNDSTLAVLRKLKDENGNYLWQPSLQNGEPDRILGYAIRTSQFAPKLAAGKAALAFGDFSYYNIGDRGQRTLQVLKELFAGNGMVGYVMKERVDGLLVLPEAVQVLKVAGTSAGGGSDDAGDDDGEG